MWRWEILCMCWAFALWFFYHLGFFFFFCLTEFKWRLDRNRGVFSVTLSALTWARAFCGLSVVFLRLPIILLNADSRIKRKVGAKKWKRQVWKQLTNSNMTRTKAASWLDRCWTCSTVKSVRAVEFCKIQCKNYCHMSSQSPCCYQDSEQRRGMIHL